MIEKVQDYVISFENILKLLESEKLPDGSWINHLCNDFDTNYSYPDLSEPAKHDEFQKFKNQIVFDLGAGSSPQTAYKLMNTVGAKGYIGVEPFNFHRAKYNLEWIMDSLKKENGAIIPASIISSDMKSVLKKIPDNSVSFITSGIDDCIITNNLYFRECADLIAEKLHRDGIHIDNFSYFNHIAWSNASLHVRPLADYLYAITKK
ncbi:MAG TPA: hypothetical protein VEC16_01070 [Alphaproteobacteria bacterium]|nr:hypothetical protein [Alphaproteobacteria bacterium]